MILRISVALFFLVLFLELFVEFAHGENIGKRDDLLPGINLGTTVVVDGTWVSQEMWPRRYSERLRIDAIDGKVLDAPVFIPVERIVTFADDCWDDAKVNESREPGSSKSARVFSHKHHFRIGGKLTVIAYESGYYSGKPTGYKGVFSGLDIPVRAGVDSHNCFDDFGFVCTLVLIDVIKWNSGASD